MIKFLGLLSKKKKVKAELAATIYVNLLNNVIEVGFVEIKDFINNNNNLEDNPNLTNLDIDWFKNIVFLGNIKNLNIFFEENDSSDLRGYILDEMYKELSKSDQHLAIERFLDYENYFDELLIENEDSIGAMAYGIFEKYNINEFQGDLFKRKNKPNPIFYNELKNLLTHFIWNWEDYLEKNKLSF
mgnify:FL=1|tara:strand:- start:673 stop:1230 length:558 start_codon:yes stop_codon:yes gene_type:complete